MQPRNAAWFTKPGVRGIIQSSRRNATSWWIGGALVLGSAASAAPAHAQGVTGRALDAVDRTPVAAVFVVLENETGDRVGATLTDPEGRFLIAAPKGTYRLATEVIGYRRTLTELFQVGDEFAPLELHLQFDAIRLEGIVATREQRCTHVEQAEATALLWDEARKALALTVWSQSHRALRYHMRAFNNTIDAHTGEVSEEQMLARTNVVDGSPYRSLPAERLFSEGFVQESEAGGYEYYVPDAELVLSDDFLSRYCFQVMADPEAPELIGLGFEPVDPGDRYDIAGALWLDRTTGRLRSLSYLHTPLPFDVLNRHQGGEVRFEQLETGEWVVSDWSLRMPVLGEKPTAAGRVSTGRRQIDVVALREVGATVIRVETGLGESMVLARALADSIAEMTASDVVRPPAAAEPGEGAAPPPITAAGYELVLTPADPDQAVAESETMATVRGVVADSAAGGAAIPFAIIRVDDASGGLLFRSLANSEGRFTIDLPAHENYRVTVEALGYDARPSVVADLRPGTFSTRIALAPQPVELEGLTARAQRAHTITIEGFGARAQKGWGLFYTGDDVDRRHPTRVSELLAGGASVRVVRRQGMDRDIEFVGIDIRANGEPCPPEIWLDGHRVRKSGEMRPFLDNVVPVNDIAGVEVYRRRTETPVAFLDAFNQCGVIVLWTKRGPRLGR